MHVDLKKHGCIISLHRQQHYGSEPTVMHHWKDFPFHIFMKWQWYFRYRAALIQVANPKLFVELRTFSYTYVPTFEEERKRAKDRLTAKKAKVTSWHKKVAAYRASWTYLFPVDDDADFIAALAKVKKAEDELTDMQQEYDTLYSKTNEAVL